MNKELEELYCQRADINAKIFEIQRSCDHLSVNKTPNGNTGNYDPSHDSYWYDCYCPNCDRKWQEPQ